MRQGRFSTDINKEQRYRVENKGQSHIIVGVAGGYCAGKNVIVGILKERGYLEIDVDKLGHEELEKSKEKIIATFSTVILDKNGLIDRKKLGKFNQIP